MRRNGRTTRMLAEAKELARQGRAVYVVAATGAQALMLERMAGDEGLRLGIKFETPESIRLDWTTMHLPTAHPNCIVLADHYAIEARFEKVLEMLHRYDE